MIYLSEEEFKYISYLRAEFLRRVEGFEGIEPTRAPIFVKNVAIRPGIKNVLRDRHPPGYEPTNIFFTRDSLYWSWRRVKECCQDLSESGAMGLEGDGDEIREKKRIYKVRYS